MHRILNVKQIFMEEIFFDWDYYHFKSIKEHSHLWDHADLDTSFLTLKKVHPNLE